MAHAERWHGGHVGLGHGEVVESEPGNVVISFSLQGTSKNRSFPRLRRQPRTQILMYSPIHCGFARAASLPSQKTPGF